MRDLYANRLLLYFNSPRPAITTFLTGFYDGKLSLLKRRRKESLGSSTEILSKFRFIFVPVDEAKYFLAFSANNAAFGGPEKRQ
jgi:hypothetical protein